MRTSFISDPTDSILRQIAFKLVNRMSTENLRRIHKLVQQSQKIQDLDLVKDRPKMQR